VDDIVGGACAMFDFGDQVGSGHAGQFPFAGWSPFTAGSMLYVEFQ